MQVEEAYHLFELSLNYIGFDVELTCFAAPEKVRVVNIFSDRFAPEEGETRYNASGMLTVAGDIDIEMKILNRPYDVTDNLR